MRSLGSWLAGGVKSLSAVKRIVAIVDDRIQSTAC